MTDAQGGSLAAAFRRLIANTGPISVMHYMGEANARYYASRDPLGAAGDFVTAPEISQMFGELIGLWMADIWLRAGQPDAVHYVELGPGRGTLARDALRAAKRFGFAPQVHLVEGSPVLRAVQAEAVPGAIWHDDLSTVPANGAMLLIANEFLDALPVHQSVLTAQGWRERMVGLDEDRFVPIAGGRPMDAAIPAERRTAPEGAIIESCPGAAATLHEVAGRLTVQGGAALFIDYGYDRVQYGSTLQAVQAHRKVDPFADPGTADLTALVDFETLAQVAASHGARWLGTVEQGAWLQAMGIDARSQALCRSAPEHADLIRSARDRLVEPAQMGRLFKVMGLASPTWPDGAGF